MRNIKEKPSPCQRRKPAKRTAQRSISNYIISNKYGKVNNFAEKINIFYEVKQRISIKEVVEYYGIHIDNKDTALCPFHSEKTPSFKVFQADNSFYCFGCGLGGDVITFTMRLFNLTNIEAVKKLDVDFRLNLPLSGKINKEDYIQSIREAERREQDKILIADFTEWEQQAFRAVASCYWILKWRGEMLFVHDVKYFEQYLPEIENIVFVKNLLDMMIENSGNFEKQVNFTASTAGRWI